MSLDEALARGEVHAAVHGAQEQTREVDVAHTGAAVPPATRHGRLHAADGGIVVRVVLAHAPGDEARDDDLVVVEGRHAEA